MPVGNTGTIAAPGTTPRTAKNGFPTRAMRFNSTVAGNLHDDPVAPVAYQVILEPNIGRFREFQSPRVHTRIIRGDFLLCTN